MGKTVTVEGFGSLYNNMLDSLELELLNERITNLDWIYVMSNVNYQHYHFDCVTKNIDNLSAKVWVLEELNKTDQRDIQIQTEECNGEPISALNYKNRVGQPKVFNHL